MHSDQARYRAIRPGTRTMAAASLSLAALFMGCGGHGAGPPPKGVEARAVPELIRGLKSSGPADRTRSAVALGRLGPAAREAVPALVATLKDRDPSVRAAVVYTLGQIGPDAKAALPNLEPLTHQGGPLREVALKAVGQIKP